MDNLNEILQNAREAVEDVIKDITSKKDVSPARLELLMKSLCALDTINSMKQKDKEYSENSYRRGRSRTTGRYMSRDNSNNYYDGNSSRNYRDSGNSSRRYNDSSGYSGHSMKDRMIAKLEEMFDEAQSRHEEQFIQDWIDRLSHDN